MSVDLTAPSGNLYHQRMNQWNESNTCSFLFTSTYVAVSRRFGLMIAISFATTVFFLKVGCFFFVVVYLNNTKYPNRYMCGMNPNSPKSSIYDPNGGPNPIPYGFCGNTGIGMGIITGDDDATIAD